MESQESIERSLYDNVGTWLNELSWTCNYPINPSIAIWGFSEAFRENGFDVDLNDTSRTLRLGKLEEVEDEPRFFETYLTYDHILNGWSRDIRGTPRTLYNSIHQVFDNMGKVLKDPTKVFTRAEHEWSHIRSSKPGKIRDSMEGQFLKYFNEHHEHLLLPVEGRIPELERPRIFHEVMKNYPLDVHLYAVTRDNMMKDECRGGPCPETLIDMEEWRFSNSYHPSDSAMTDYFWGMYLQELQKEKRYPFAYEDSGLMELVAGGERALKSGYQIKWNYSVKD